MKSKNQRRRQKKKELKTQEPDDESDGQNSGQVDSMNADPVYDSTQESGSKSTVLARKYDWINEKDSLYDMYQTISSRSKRKRLDEPVDLPSDKNGTSLAQSSQPGSQQEVEELQQNNERLRSKKQQRLASKPSLAALKSSTSKPELVEWYDADAPYPEFLVQMKSVPGAVQVPLNWHLRQEIPQFGPKPPYSLPEPIKSTKAADVRERQKASMAQHGAKIDASANDLDYESFHSAFFGPTAIYPLPHLLPFGEIVDSKLRNRDFKPHSMETSNKKLEGRTLKSPPKLSSPASRKALSSKPGETAPWVPYVAKHGLAPGFTSEAAVETKLWGEIS